MASKPKKGAADEVAKLVARYGWKAVKEAEKFAGENFFNKAVGNKLVSKKTMSKKARKLTESQIKNDKQYGRYVDRTMQRGIEKRELIIPVSSRKSNYSSAPAKFNKLSDKRKGKGK